MVRAEGAVSTPVRDRVGLAEAVFPHPGGAQSDPVAAVM